MVLFRNQKSIGQRLMAIVMGTSAVATVIGSVCYVLAGVVVKWDDAVQDSTSLARITGRNCEAALAFQIPQDAEGMLSALRSSPSVAMAILLTADGARFAAYNRDGVDIVSPPPGIGAANYVDGSLWVSSRVSRGGRHLGTLYLRNDLSLIRQSVRRDLIVLAIVTSIAMLTAYVVARGLIPHITGPVLRLTETARVVSERHDYSVRADIESPDEIGVLTRTFNEMLEGIQAREAALRKANADIEAAHDELENKVRERTAELARSNSDLEQFAYVASHDLQEPLRKVKSFTQLFAESYAGKIDEQGARYVGYIVDGADRMQRLIQDLLAYSRVSRIDLEREEADLNAVLKDALSNLETMIHESGAVIDSDRLPTVRVNVRMVGMAFQNLVSNAIKFRSDSVPRVHVGARRGNGEWVLSVTDNGIGIDPRHFGRLFQVFQRLHSKSAYQGTGIGLALCKKIVERHDGRIWVESEPGKGSTFLFTLPDRAVSAPASGVTQGVQT